MCWCVWCVDVLMCWWLCWCVECVDDLLCWWLCWCVDVLMRWCVDNYGDVLMALRWCVDVLMRLMCWCVDVLMTVLVSCVDVLKCLPMSELERWGFGVGKGHKTQQRKHFHEKNTEKKTNVFWRVQTRRQAEIPIWLTRFTHWTTGCVDVLMCDVLNDCVLLMCWCVDEFKLMLMCVLFVECVVNVLMRWHVVVLICWRVYVLMCWRVVLMCNVLMCWCVDDCVDVLRDDKMGKTTCVQSEGADLFGPSKCCHGA
jgi:hypothetical protein